MLGGVHMDMMKRLLCESDGFLWTEKEPGAQKMASGLFVRKGRS